MAAGDLTRIKLSASTDGQNIKVVATATPGTTVHTAHATDMDEIYLEACNPGATARVITIQWGGTSSPDDYTTITIEPGVGWVPIVQGKLLTNSKVVKIFAAAANEII